MDKTLINPKNKNKTLSLSESFEDLKMEIITKGQKIIIDCEGYSTKEMMKLLAVIPRWKTFFEQIPNKELIDKLPNESSKPQASPSARSDNNDFKKVCPDCNSDNIFFGADEYGCNDCYYRWDIKGKPIQKS